MRKYVLFLLLLLFNFAILAQNNKEKMPDIDKELLRNLYHMMCLPEGVHKIYNGKGKSVFDVLYTIEIKKDKWTVYKGGSKSIFDIIYSVSYANEEYRIYKGHSNSIFNIIYTIKKTDNGFELYKGNSTVSFDLLYSYERNQEIM